MHCHMPFRIHVIIFELRCVCRDLPVRYMCMKAPFYPVWSNRANPAFVRTVFAALSGKGSYLKVPLLHDPLDFFLIDHNSLIPQFPIHTAVSIIPVGFMDFHDFFFYPAIRIFPVKSFLPVHIGCFWKTGYSENVF